MGFYLFALFCFLVGYTVATFLSAKPGYVFPDHLLKEFNDRLLEAEHVVFTAAKHHKRTSKPGSPRDKAGDELEKAYRKILGVRQTILHAPKGRCRHGDDWDYCPECSH